MLSIPNLKRLGKLLFDAHCNPLDLIKKEKIPGEYMIYYAFYYVYADRPTTDRGRKMNY